MNGRTTTLHWKPVIDAADPHTRVDLWARTPGHAVEDRDAPIERLLDLGHAPAGLTVEVCGRRA